MDSLMPASAMLDRCRRVASLALLSVVVGIVSLAAPAWALDPDTAITQYAADTWEAGDWPGIGYIRDITQSADGYLWLATQEGVVRFDGQRFALFDRRNTPQLRQPSVTCLLAEDDEGIWLGTESGLYRIDSDGTVTHDVDDEVTSLEILDLARGSDGALWIAAAQGLFRYVDDELQRSEYPLLRDSYITDLMLDGDGSLWIGVLGTGLARLHDGQITTLTTADGLPDGDVRAILRRADGSLVVATGRGGLDAYVNGSFIPLFDEQSRSAWQPVSLLEDRDGNLWIGTRGDGLYRYRQGIIDRYDKSLGLPQDWVWSVYEDREGSLWLSAGTLPHRLRDASVTVYARREGLPDDIISTLEATPDGGVWVGTHKGLGRIEDGRASVVSNLALDGEKIQAIMVGEDGSLWLGASSSGLWRLRDGQWTRWGTEDGLPHHWIATIIEDRHHALWIGTSRGLCHLVDDLVDTCFTDEHGLPSRYVQILHEDRDGVLWIGTRMGIAQLRDGRIDTLEAWRELSAGQQIIKALHEDEDGVLWVATKDGLVRMAGDRIDAISISEGLYDANIHWIEEDGQGRLWMSANRGLFHIAKEEIDELLAGERTFVTYEYVGKSDGMRSTECNGGVLPAGTRTPDGRLWFATTVGAVAIEPDNEIHNPHAPPVVIERVTAGGVDVEIQPNQVFAAGTQRFEFHYTATTFIDPDKVRFRVHLEGLDEDWSEPTDRRSAYYSNLEPGSYVFRVIAANADDVWNDTGEAYAFELESFFYQTTWFAAAVVIALLLSGFTVPSVYYRLRERAIQRIVQERTRELALANEKLQQANQELQQAQRQLVETAHLAGRGEIAAEVLHSVGNSLNTLNVSAESIREKVDQAPLWVFIERLATLLEKHREDLATFLSQDDQGQKACRALLALPEHVGKLQLAMAGELDSFSDQIATIRDAVWAQQTHVSHLQFSEPFTLRELIGDVLTLCHEDLSRVSMEVDLEIQGQYKMQGNRPQLMLVLGHVVRNASEACEPAGSTDSPPHLVIRDELLKDGRVSLSFADPGQGISSDQLTDVFRHGTTSKDGHHGFGLHYCANVMHELGGSVEISSKGRGKGTTVTLIWPVTGKKK